MVKLAFRAIVLATLTSFFSSFVLALSPGSYFIVNVGFSGRRVFTGMAPGQPLLNQGFPVFTSLPQSINDPVLANHIFTIDSTMTTLFNEEAQQFAVVDASLGGSAGAGIILCTSTNPPVPPFNFLGDTAWSFQQGSEGMIIVLAGTELAWSLLVSAFGTQITLQPLNPGDLRQQWQFIAHSLV